MIKVLVLLMAATICALFFISCKKELACRYCTEANNSPIVNAGPDITVATACGKAEIAGFMSSSDSTASVLWRQLAGPTHSTIVNPNKPKTLVFNLTAGTYRYMLEVKDKNGTGRDTMDLTVKHTKEITVDNLTWDNLVDDMVHVWTVTIRRPDLFCDTSQIKEISIMNNNAWLSVEPVWMGPGLTKYVSGMGSVDGGYYYEHFSGDILTIYVYGGIWGRNTSVRVRFH